MKKSVITAKIKNKKKDTQKYYNAVQWFKWISDKYEKYNIINNKTNDTQVRIKREDLTMDTDQVEQPGFITQDITIN